MVRVGRSGGDQGRLFASGKPLNEARGVSMKSLEKADRIGICRGMEKVRVTHRLKDIRAGSHEIL